jgi:hypothetical protein
MILKEFKGPSEMLINYKELKVWQKNNCRILEVIIYCLWFYFRIGDLAFAFRGFK